ncbi:TonB-dependent receptor plug domain-containing protein [Marilutibacter alkalisoli]|uniref:TonB-dependent receptor n=1 Tax=Marilutibacter alkalisoli TaxID=2591633 RepID=A0A514BPH1_9GAMM|nr:TonB-dependent receptor [Lysobacter alkalisoli]QDH69235.1 TonB-dependent receptor [Lysobacter alkalisoli]
MPNFRTSPHLTFRPARLSPIAAALALALSAAAHANDDLGRRATELDAVEVKVSTATRSERLLSDVPVRTEVLRGEDIELRAVLDFSRAAELINGLRVESNCQNCNTSEAQLLGLGGAYNQVLFDGVPLMSTLGSVYGLEQIPAAFINTVEVVKGGGSSLYGPGAVAGVINLIPQRPVNNGGFLRYGVDVQKGEPQHNLDGRVDRLSGDRRLGVSVVGQASSNDAIDFNGDGYSEITEKDQQMLGVQGWYSLGDDSMLRANYQFTREKRRGGNRLDQPEWRANIAESLETKYHRGGVNWERIVSDRFDFSLGYAFAWIERDSFYGGLGDVATDPADPDFDPADLDPTVPGSPASVSWNQYGHTENPLHYLDSQFNWYLGAHAVAFGLQYKRESVRDGNRNAVGGRVGPVSDERFTNIGLYVQDEWAVDENVDLVLGLRADRHSALDKAIFSPRVALAWAASDRLKLRAGLSTGFRAPEVFSEDLHVETLGAEPIHIRNAEGLVEERAATGMFGLDWRSDPAEPRWTWDATVSWTRLRDTFVLSEIRDDGDGGLYQQRDNASGSRVAGVETNLGWQPGEAFRLSAGVAWYRSRHDEAQVVFDDRDEGGDTVIATREYLKTPEWSGLAQAIWSPNGDWDAYLGLKYTGRMQVLNNTTGTLNRSPEFWVVDIGATRHFHGADGGGWDVSFGLRNLFDQRQKDLEAGADRDSEYVYGPRFARSIYAGVRYAF